jgi:hypothetical protein
VVPIRGLILTACVLLCSTACGGGAPHSTTTAKTCVSPRANAKLRADIAAVKRAAALPTRNRLLGNRQINAATDTFLNDVALAPIDNKQRNRMIDHAAGALAGSCEQCFQALEAARPVVGIRVGDQGC